MFVYAMLSETGEVKIGKSITPMERAHQISQDFNTNIVDMIYIRCDEYTSKIEQLCHIMHEDKMVSREWFNISFDHAIATIRTAKVFCAHLPDLKARQIYKLIKAGLEFYVRFPYEEK